MGRAAESPPAPHGQGRVGRGQSPVMPATGAAVDAASAEPIITASAPHTMAFAMSRRCRTATVRDHMAVDAGLVEMPHARRPGVGDASGLATADAEHV